jgi:hypothetical protein
MLHSVLIGMATVDAFLMTQALLPDRGLEDTDGSMGTFVMKLVAHMLPPVSLVEPSAGTPGSANSNATSSSSSTSTAPPSASNGPERNFCVLERIGHATIQSGDRAGKKRPMAATWMGDVPCVRAGRPEGK